MQTRRELHHIRKELDWYHRSIGETIMWASYDAGNSEADDVYNEPGGRSYRTAVPVQTLWINVTEAGKRIDEERFDNRNQVSLAVAVHAFRNAGVPDVLNDNERVFDVFKYWGRVWSVQDYEIIARFPQEDSSTIGIQAVEVDLRSDYPFEPGLSIEA